MVGDAQGFVEGLEACFGELEDPRNEESCDHLLFDILAISVLAIACGVDDWCDLATFAKVKLEWLKKFLALPEGAPSHDTFRRVFGLLDRNQFAANLFHWTQALQAATGGKLVAMNTDFAHVPHEMQATQETAHGRTTERTYQAIEIQRDHPQRQKWRDLRTLVIATSCVTQNQEGPGRRGSSSADLAPRGKPLEQTIRKHWGIENSQHWVLDEAFHEDAARQQDRNGSANLAAVRRLIVSLLRQETTLQRGDKAKRMVCALDTDYLLKVFANANINA